MNALAIVIVAAVVFVLAYVFYGGWLARQWGVDPDRTMPSEELEDGIDYVPAPSYVVFGHHFSSIAGAGAINGPILAALFGWVPVVLWIVIGGVLVGAVHDFGSLFSSLRHKGVTLVAVIRENVDDTAKTTFCIFAYFSLVLLVAALISIVASAFQVVETQAAAVNELNSRVAFISLLFVVAAVAWGFLTRGRRVPAALSVVGAIAVVAIVVAVGFNVPGFVALGHDAWVVVLGVYILAAAVAPMWALLQPRDYLSSFLLYGLIVLSVVGIGGAGAAGAATDLQIPAFTGFAVNAQAFDAATGAPFVDASGAPVMNLAAQGGFLFPVLFVTVGCGAVSGFHSLVSSGTTSKQVVRESQAKAIGFGGMLVECLIAIVALCAVGFVWARYAAGEYASPVQVFADGITRMLACVPGLEDSTELAYSLIMLAVSVLCLTTLDTATRLARYLFQEFWAPADAPAGVLAGAQADATANASTGELPGWRKALCNRYVATVVTVVLAVGLGMAGHSAIWSLFGTANQLLAALALLTVCAWLGNAGRNNKMLLVPMVLMFAVSLASLLLMIQQKAAAIMVGGDVVVPGVQLVLACAMLVLAVVMAVKGARALSGGTREALTRSR